MSLMVSLLMTHMLLTDTRAECAWNGSVRHTLCCIVQKNKKIKESVDLSSTAVQKAGKENEAISVAPVRYLLLHAFGNFLMFYVFHFVLCKMFVGLNLCCIHSSDWKNPCLNHRSWIWDLCIANGQCTDNFKIIVIWCLSLSHRVCLHVFKESQWMRSFSGMWFLVVDIHLSVTRIKYFLNCKIS